MNKFNIGQTVFYVNFPERKIGSRIIHGIDIVDGTTRYWLQGYFGYFSEDSLFERAQHAEDNIKHREASNDQLNKRSETK